MIETSISDGPATQWRNDRVRALGGVQRELKVIGTLGPPVSPDVFELLLTAQTAVMDLEAAIADEGIREMVR